MSLWIFFDEMNSKMPRTTEMDPITPKYNTSVSNEYRRTICALIACAEAFDKNQRLIVCAENAAGASFVVADKPTGDRHNSPRTTRKKLRTSHNGLTSVSVPYMSAGMIITINDRPASTNPNENFFGVDGCLSPSLIQNHAKTGANMTMNNGFNDWNQ